MLKASEVSKPTRIHDRLIRSKIIHVIDGDCISVAHRGLDRYYQYRDKHGRFIEVSVDDPEDEIPTSTLGDMIITPARNAWTIDVSDTIHMPFIYEEN